MYAPELWGEADRFSKFYSGTFTFKDTTQRAVSGVINHFNKALIFKNIAEKLRPNLLEDQKELHENGFTPAQNSNELSSVIEEVFTELYSSIDCTRQIVFEIHKKCRGLPDSTRKMFQKLASDEVVAQFPEPLREAFRDAKWFVNLRVIRDELTHSNIGNCHLDKETGKISYFHQGIKKSGAPLSFDDIFSEVEKTFDGVYAFLGYVFHYLNSQLKSEPVLQICGIFFGRVYTRHVAPSEAIDFHGGSCDSYVWFERPENPSCPFSASCGAYASAKDS